MEHRGRRLEPLPPAWLAALLLAILGLGILIAAASRPDLSGLAGPAGTAATEAAILRALVILVAVAEVVVGGLILWALWPGEGRQRRVVKRRGNLAVAAASFLQTASVLVLFWLYLHRRAQLGGAGQGLFGLQAPNSFASLPRRASAVAGGQDWLTVLIVLLVIGLAASILLSGIGLGRRGSRRAPLADRLQRAVEEGLGELEFERDPRRAVIAAYARMERSLAAAGLARSQPEAAQEYLARLLGQLGVSGEPARRLTDLYQLAKFSQHPIDEAMKSEAIAALVELRDELREQAEAEAVAGRVATA